MIGLKPAEELAYFTGVMIGDGYLDSSGYNRRIGLEVTSKNFKQRFIECLKALSKKSIRSNSYIRRYKIGKYSYTSKLHRILVTDKNLVLVGIKAKNLNFMFRTREEQIAFIKGFFDSDGCKYTTKIKYKDYFYKYGRIEFANSNKKLLKLVQNILNSLGHEFLFKKEKENLYRLTLNKQEGVKRFVNEIGEKYN